MDLWWSDSTDSIKGNQSAWSNFQPKAKEDGEVFNLDLNKAEDYF